MVVVVAVLVSCLKSLVDPLVAEKRKGQPEPWVKLGIGGREIGSK
jgi:hypothetical protein